MKILHVSLPVQFKFFGGPKAFDTQSFDSKLAEFRNNAYAGIAESHDYPRARSLIDEGINAIRTLLKNIWNTPEKLVYVRFPSIHVFMEVDNNYTAYSVKISLCHDYIEKYENAKSSNFDEVVQAEKDEMIEKYGFKELPLKKYRVKFENYEAVLNELQIVDIQKEYPTLYFDFEEIK